MLSKFNNILCSRYPKIIAHIQLGRYDKPIGSMLLYMPCVWGVILGQPTYNLSEVLWYSGVFGVGAFTQRAAGCIVNDMFDRDIDKQVDRTKLRPLAAGTISMNEAGVSLALHLGVGLGVLTQLSWSAIIASFAIVPVAALYPLAKRYFRYPQLILGLNFNWGIIVGGIQAGGGILNPAILLCYAAGIVQTLIYDTIYAHQDVKQDKLLNLYSTAYTLPREAPLYLTVPFGGLLMLSCMYANYSNVTLIMLALQHIQLWRHIQFIDLDDPQQCAKFFKGFYLYQISIALILLFGSSQKLV